MRYEMYGYEMSNSRRKDAFREYESFIIDGWTVLEVVENRFVYRYPSLIYGDIELSAEGFRLAELLAEEMDR